MPADYFSFFIHDLELEKMDISTGDFPVEQLSNAIIKSSMIDYACKIYEEQKKKLIKNQFLRGFVPMFLLQRKQKEKLQLIILKLN